ncbi:DUF3320 domain-containing protein [Profundibacterium mesophilum]|uniref:DUF3320 domain-containing protein n=1 Tax=Profundibacterium mesophilum TaxID=1258573 RepID=UPI001F22B974|nr:DUF3320 domain-containing protein [Profundibacterium mesophilum]
MNDAGPGDGMPVAIVEAEIVQRVNFASAQNDVPVIRSLSVTNLGASPLERLELVLTAEPAILRSRRWVIDSLGAGETLRLVDLSTPLDIGLLAGLDEAEHGTLRLSLSDRTETLAERSLPVELLARDQWGGLAEMDRLLAAYVSPNDAAVAAILKEASRLLEASGRDGAIEGYQSADPRRAWMLAGAIWSAATGLGLTYATPPASFEHDGQKVRFPHRIRSEGLATCLDISLLLAAAWEQAGLNPVVLFTEGHAFAGVWLTARDFGQVTEPDIVAVRKAAQAHEFVPVETTYLTKRPAIGFEEAAEAGRALLREENEHAFLAAIDIARARAARIRPLAAHLPAQGDEDAADAEAAPAGLPAPLDLGVLPAELAQEAPATPRGRIERWQGKLLDLSLRNRLLNFKPTKQTVPCLVPDLGALEDALAGGQSFRVYPMREEDPVGLRQVPADERERIIASAVADAAARGQVPVDLDRNEMERRLLTLFRKAKSDVQEGGTNTLFLAVGFLRWQREGDTQPYRAPLLLVPVKLERRSARSEFSIVHHEDDVRFNATLLEFLKRDFDLALPELEGELPRDGSGIDLPLIFRTMRMRVRDVPGFEVVEDVALSTFSFSKYLMWKDLVDRTDDLRTNRLVAHLVDNPDRPFETGQGDPVRPEELDARLAPSDLLTPLPADSSQLAAVVAATDGRDFVLIGPPGTGKSQTIANIICQILAQGRTVLFVAEKAAALDVVQRRLEAHGMGDAVLELHSNKTDRKRVLNQLGRGWDRAAGGPGPDWVQVNAQLKLERDRLNSYVAALHAKGPQGFSIFDAISWTADDPNGPALRYADKDAHDAESFALLERTADALARTFAATRDIPPMPLVTATDWSFAWQDALINSAREMRVLLDRLAQCGSRLSHDLGLGPAPGLPTGRAALLDRLADRAGADAADLRAVPQMTGQDLLAALDAFEAKTARLDALRAATSARYDEAELARMPLDALDLDWRKAEASFWPFSALRRRRVRRMMQGYAASGAADPGRDLGALLEMRPLVDALNGDPLSTIAGQERSTRLARRAARQAIALRAALAEAGDAVADAVAFGRVQAALPAIPEGALREGLAQWAALRAEARDRSDALAALGADISGLPSIEGIMREIDTVLAHRERLADWTLWREARAQAEAHGLGPLADRLEAGEEIGEATAEFRSAYARWWLPLALDASAPLRRFAQWDHEDAVKAFRDLDARAAELAPAEVMRRIEHELPGRDGVPRNSELGTLRHQLGLQRPSMAIRTLLGNLTQSFPRLAPCVLMSPLSIAQYLPAGQAAFDVVIFDEASQITTWDAVGAIARARQSIVVGDPKQLPPTNFFGRSNDDEEDAGDGLMGDMPSILDEVANAGIPTRRLNWHYRSRDEALIAFSNHHYYGGGLVTFPAPSTRSEAVHLHRIEGTYARGGARVNVPEAQAIVAMIERRLSEWLTLDPVQRQTLGVITFNAQQQALILDHLDALRRTRPDLEWFFAEEREEPVIVKNLESIQGDERDVMLFSITFGPDAAGRLSMAFGALNLEGGERRLNVAVTRARRELHVFASLSHEEIDLGRTRATGVRHLKAFLDYAQRGAIALAAEDGGSLGPAENPFEEAVAQAFRAKGWEVRTQIGVSGFRIDLAIVHPRRAGVYLAGIECDGASYHSSATARDRDKVRQAVLEGLGWSILRVWSTEWFRHPDPIVDRLHAELEALLAADPVPDPGEIDEGKADIAHRSADRAAPLDGARPALAAPARFPDRPEVGTARPGAGGAGEGADARQGAGDDTPAEGASCAGGDPAHSPEPPAASPGGSDDRTDPPRADPEAFFEADYTAELRRIVDGILERRAPVTLPELCREVARQHGWQRTGRRINDRVAAAVSHADRREEDGRLFLWPAGGHEARTPFRGMADRAVHDVSRTEIAALLDAHSEALDASGDPARELARLMGINRLSGTARRRLESVIEWYRAHEFG